MKSKLTQFAFITQVPGLTVHNSSYTLHISTCYSESKKKCY